MSTGSGTGLIIESEIGAIFKSSNISLSCLASNKLSLVLSDWLGFDMNRLKQDTICLYLLEYHILIINLILG